MSVQPVVVGVGSYRSRAEAEHDFGEVLAFGHQGGAGQLAAAVVEKGRDGRLEIDCHQTTAARPACGAVLLGSAMTVVAVPLGIAFLASLLGTRADWAGPCGLVADLWHQVPRELLRNMGNLLESGQAGLVVVAVDHDADDVASLLLHATTKVVTGGIPADLEAGLAVDRARHTGAAP